MHLFTWTYSLSKCTPRSKKILGFTATRFVIGSLYIYIYIYNVHTHTHTQTHRPYFAVEWASILRRH